MKDFASVAVFELLYIVSVITQTGCMPTFVVYFMSTITDFILA